MSQKRYIYIFKPKNNLHLGPSHGTMCRMSPPLSPPLNTLTSIMSLVAKDTMHFLKTVIQFYSGVIVLIQKQILHCTV